MGNRKGKDVSTSDSGGGGWWCGCLAPRKWGGMLWSWAGEKMPAVLDVVFGSGVQSSADASTAKIHFTAPTMHAPRIGSQQALSSPKTPRSPTTPLRATQGNAVQLLDLRQRVSGKESRQETTRHGNLHLLQFHARSSQSPPRCCAGQPQDQCLASTPNPGPSAGHARKLSALHATH